MISDFKCEVCGAAATSQYRDSIEVPPIRDIMGRTQPRVDQLGRVMRNRYGEVVMEPIWWKQYTPGPARFRCNEHKTEGQEIDLRPQQRGTIIRDTLRKSS